MQLTTLIVISAIYITAIIFFCYVFATTRKKNRRPRKARPMKATGKIRNYAGIGFFLAAIFIIGGALTGAIITAVDHDNSTHKGIAVDKEYFPHRDGYKADRSEFWQVTIQDGSKNNSFRIDEEDYREIKQGDYLEFDQRDNIITHR